MRPALRRRSNAGSQAASCSGDQSKSSVWRAYSRACSGQKKSYLRTGLGICEETGAAAAAVRGRRGRGSASAARAGRGK